MYVADKNDQFEAGPRGPAGIYDIALYTTISFTDTLISSKNQSAKIKATINSYLDQGLTDKQVIYNKVVDELGVPRPTVRRVARDLRNELLEKIRILQSTMTKEAVADHAAATGGSSGGATSDGKA